MLSSLETAASPVPQPESRALAVSESGAMIVVVAFMILD
jgi:hypothetical protein